MPKKPVWTEGLLISQHHFQQQDRYHEATLRDRLRATLRYDWGITELEVDEPALASGQVRLRRFSAILPDGTPIQCGEGGIDPLPQPRAIDQYFPAHEPKLDVYVALREETENAPNLDDSRDSVQAARFVRQTHPVFDLVTGQSPHDYDWAEPNLKILFGPERRDGYNSIRIAQLVRNAAGAIIVRDTYVPPVLRIGTAPFLMAGLNRILSALAGRQRELASSRKTVGSQANVAFHAIDTRRFWLLHTVNGTLPAVTHLLDGGRAHPEEAYLVLATLIGQLWTFSSESEMPVIPKFQYLDMGETFEPMFARILSLMSAGVEQSYVEIPLEHRADGMYTGRFADAKLLQHELFIGVTANLADPLVRERLPNVVKIASWNQIYDIVKQWGVGVKMQPEFEPPSALPLKPGVCFFRLRKEGARWDEIAKTSTVALYVPNEPDWKNLALALYAVEGANL